MDEHQLAEHLATAKSDRRPAAGRAFEAIADAAGSLIESLVVLSPVRQRPDHRQVALIALHEAISTFDGRRRTAFWGHAKRRIQWRLLDERRKEAKHCMANATDEQEQQMPDAVDELADRIEDEHGSSIEAELSKMLTTQEAAAVRLVAAGKTDKQVGHSLKITTKAAEQTIGRARAKLQPFALNGQKLFERRDVIRFSRRSH